MDPPTPIVHEFVVAAEDEGRRLDHWLVERPIGLSRSRLQRLIEQGHVSVDGKACPARHRVKAGQRVRVEVPPAEEVALEPDPSVPLEILYEDEQLAVVLKPAGVVVHPAPGNWSGTLVHGLMARLSSLSGVGGRLRPGIVHRLDRDTSGLMVIAKTDRAHHALQEQLRARTLGRIYEAICWGRPRLDRDRLEYPLDRDPHDRKRRAVVEGGRPAVTDYRVLEELRGATRLRLRLWTGRTHQIRVHLAHRGHPVLGDEVYGGGSRRLAGAHPHHRPALSEALRALDRQALHAVELHFVHPVREEPMEWVSPLPASMERALEILRPDRPASDTV